MQNERNAATERRRRGRASRKRRVVNGKIAFCVGVCVAEAGRHILSAVDASEGAAGDVQEENVVVHWIKMSGEFGVGF